MDVMGNLYFIITLLFFSLVDEGEFDWKIWLAIVGFFAMLISVDYIGSRSTVSSNEF